MAKLDRLIAVILMLAMLISVFPASALAVEETDYTEVTLSLNSNTTLDTSVTGLYKDNVFYVTLPILCDLINAEIEDETSDYVKISTNYGYRLFCLYFNESKVEEYLTSEYSYTVTLPQMQYDENIYVSLIHFLEFLDIDYQIGNKGSHNLIIYKRYNIFDAIGEYIKTSHGNHFEWQEVDISEDTAMNSAILALISSDPNILKMVFNPDGMMQDHMEDALLAIVRNEGNTDNEDEDGLEGAYQGMSLTKDLLGMIQESYKAEKLPKAGALAQLSKKVDNIGLGADFLMAGVAAFESAAKFDYMTELQQSLLSDTIIEHFERAEVLEGAWDIAIDAANEIQFRVNDTYQNNLTAARESTIDLIYGLTQGAITNADPYTAAINAVFSGFFFITESLLPEAYEYADAVYQAYNCYVLQFASNEIFVSLHNELSDNNYCIEDVGTQETYWKQIKQSLALKLKSTITLRDYLFEGDCIEPEFQLEQTIKNEGNIGLLSRVESCELLCLTNSDPSYEDDLSWMRESSNAKTLTQIIEYDDSGNLTYEFVLNYNDDGSLSNTSSKSRYDFDGINRIYEYEKTYVYDDKGRLVRIEKPEDGYVFIDEYVYNENGQLIRSSDQSDGGWSENTYEYDSEGRLIKEVSEYEVYTDVTKYAYDSNGLLVETQIVRDFGDSFPENYTSTYEYDSERRVTKIVTEGSSDIQIETYTYDSVGRKKTYTMEDNWSTVRESYNYEYAPFVIVNRSEKRQWGEHDFIEADLYDDAGRWLSALSLVNPEFLVDADGYLAKVVDESSIYEFYYDGQLAQPLEDQSREIAEETTPAHESTQPEDYPYDTHTVALMIKEYFTNNDPRSDGVYLVIYRSESDGSASYALKFDPDDPNEYPEGQSMPMADITVDMMTGEMYMEEESKGFLW